LTLETPDHQHGKEQESCLVIKEPWATPNRATPKGCYPFKKKLKNILKKNIPKNQSKNSKRKSKQKNKKKNTITKKMKSFFLKKV